MARGFNFSTQKQAVRSRGQQGNAIESDPTMGGYGTKADAGKKASSESGETLGRETNTS